MKLELDISEELEAQLTAEATKAGTGIETYVLRLLAGNHIQQGILNGAELVEYWQKEGLIGTCSEASGSQQHARALREKAQQRHTS